MKTREEIIHSMCVAWDSSYEHQREPEDVGLYKTMRQVFDREIAPLLGMQPTPKGKVRVRIACYVNASGQWAAAGYFGANDMQSSDIASGMMEGFDQSTELVHFIEATVPIPCEPEPTTLEGVVIQEKA